MKIAVVNKMIIDYWHYILKAGFHMIADRRSQIEDSKSRIADRRSKIATIRSAIVCDPAIVIADDRRR